MTEATQAPGEGPVTVVITRKVLPGKEQEYEAWIKGVTAAALRFPGHLGINILRPSAPDQREYVLIFRFDTYAHLASWESSQERADWVARARPLTEGEARREVRTGLEYWFTLPGAPRALPPPRHKMAVVTWLAIVPLIYGVVPAMGVLLGDLPALLRTMLSAAVMVSLMTYAVMPLMTRLFARWLFPGRS